MEMKLQRKWAEQKPLTYEKETNLVCMDIKEEVRTENGEEKQGYSFYQVEIDRHIDYGHIKSQLIEAAFPQKDEFGLLMNAVDDLITAISTASTMKEAIKALDTTDIKTFGEFCAFRDMCANTAKEIVAAYE